MTSAKEIVERMQSEAWGRLGISTDRIEAQRVDEMKKELLFLSGVIPSIDYDEQFLTDYWAQIERDNKTTAFQDPFALANFRVCWQRLRDVENATSAKEPFPAPLLASAPTGDLNAQAIVGDDGSTALLLEEELENWALCFTHVVVALLASQCNDRIELAPSFDYLKHKEDEIEIFGQLLAFTAANGKPGFMESEKGHAMPRTMYIPELGQLTVLARAGFVTFVAGHEYAHLRLNHHAKIRSAHEPYKVRSEYKEIWKRYVEKYRTRFPSFSGEVLLQKLRRQFFENEADQFGYAHAQATIRSLLEQGSDPTFDSDDSADALVLQAGTKHPFIKWYFSELGMISFFLSIDYLERTIRTLANGNDGRNDPLLSDDFDVQDVLLRHSHPSPTTRLRWVCKTVDSSGQQDDTSITKIISHQLEEILSHVWDVVYPLIQKLHASGVRPHRKWVDPSAEMSCTLI